MIHDNIMPDDFPTEDTRTIASIIGVDSAIKLFKELSGRKVCIPCRIVFKKKNRAYILKQFGIKSITEIKRHTGISEKSIYNIVRAENNRIKHLDG